MLNSLSARLDEIGSKPNVSTARAGFKDFLEWGW